VSAKPKDDPPPTGPSCGGPNCVLLVGEIRQRLERQDEVLAEHSDVLGRIETAVIGDEVHGHRGLIKRTDTNEENIAVLKANQNRVVTLAITGGAVVGAIVSVVLEGVKLLFKR